MDEIRYGSEEIKQLCTDKRYARGKLSVQGMKKLRTRMADLVAAPTVTELPIAGNPHPLKYDLAGHYAVGLDGGRRLVFKPIEPAPRNGSGDIEWQRVTRIIITAIEDYHRG
jgi:toxin HigB-1